MAGILWFMYHRLRHGGHYCLSELSNRCRDLVLLHLVGITNDDFVELTQTGTSRNEVTADNVLLHTLEVVGLSADGCFVEHLRCLLEGCGRHEALRLERSTRDTLENLG